MFTAEVYHKNLQIRLHKMSFILKLSKQYPIHFILPRIGFNGWGMIRFCSQEKYHVFLFVLQVKWLLVKHTIRKIINTILWSQWLIDWKRDFSNAVKDYYANIYRWTNMRKTTVHSCDIVTQCASVVFTLSWFWPGSSLTQRNRFQQQKLC